MAASFDKMAAQQLRRNSEAKERELVVVDIYICIYHMFSKLILTGAHEILSYFISLQEISDIVNVSEVFLGKSEAIGQFNLESRKRINIH